ncbi:MAG: dienelactone hydrolase family protein [Bdellovibrionaceae bacterium]|nr:dienelactone hydrolase family protein [Pseudobdellovibrionaceae bacterium]
MGKKIFQKILIVCVGLLAQESYSLEIKNINYSLNEKKFEGVLLQQNEKNKKPIIVMIHNWMGISEETKNQGRRFAELGYNVFLADIYGENIRPKDVKEAATLATKYKKDRKQFRENIRLAIDTAKKQPGVDANKLVVVGYCFGGTGAIEIARDGIPLSGVISFHGGLDSLNPEEGKNIKTSVLALHGEDDPYVAKEDLLAFENEMKAYKINYQLIKYPKAVHSFTDKGAGSDNSKGAAYNEEADKKSFQEATQFLKRVFKK